MAGLRRKNLSEAESFSSVPEQRVKWHLI